MSLIPIALTFATHVVIPLLFVWWVGMTRAASRLYWLLVVTLVGASFAVLQVAGAGWHWFGFYWMYVYWALYIAAIAWFASRRFRVLPWLPEPRVKAWAALVTVGVFGLFFASSAPALTTTRDFEGETVELQFPLPEGVFHIAHGGASEAVNHHHVVRAQRYGLDIMRLNGWSIRARGLLPKRLDDYAIWETPILSPCSGEVVAGRDGLPDQLPPKRDRGNVAGNYVAVYCEGVTVVLAHLKQGSVTVSVGERVRVGQRLGLVGNSGNTSEPHLHMHAVRGRHSEPEQIGWKAEGVPLRLCGRFLVRNERITMPDACAQGR